MIQYFCIFTEELSVDKVNKALAASSKEELYEALADPKAKYPPVLDYATALYFEEFSSIKEEKGVSNSNLMSIR